MKRFFTWTLPAFLILLSIPLTSAAYDFEVDGIYYNKYGETVEVTSGSVKYSGDVTIPSQVTYSGTTYSVGKIGEYAFSGCNGLTSISIPSSIGWIRYDAFNGCSGLKKVIISDIAAWCEIFFEEMYGPLTSNPLYYAHHLFLDGIEITNLEIPDSVTSISRGAFYNCSGLTSVSIPNSVTDIDSYAFCNCSGLTSVTIPNSVTSIGNYAFNGCSGLTSVTIPNSIRWISYGAFNGCSGLKKVIISDIAAWCEISFGEMYGEIGSNPLYFAHHLFLNDTEITDLVIPDSVTSISYCAFQGCSGLTSVTIPNSVTSIGNYAFDGCSGLSLVTIPNSVTEIGYGTFYNCSDLTSVSIPNSVTKIGEKAFSGCSGLTSVVVPNSVTSIGENAFFACGKVTVYAFPIPYYSRTEKWGLDYSQIMLVGGPLYVIDDVVGIHQESIDFVIKSIDYEPAPEGYESVEPDEYGIYNSYYYYPINSDQPQTINNLRSNQQYTFKCYTKYNGKTIFFDERTLTTHNLGVKVTYSNTVTTLSANYTYQMDDAVFDRESITFNGKTIEEHKLFVTGLKPNTSYKVKYTVYTKGGSSETKEFNFNTPALELTILKPNSVSSTCSIVAAETNMSDDETSAGFQWKKYDAPASLDPNEAYAAIYGGRLEGYIKNLQSTSYYNVRAFYKASDGTYYYSDWKTFDPSDFSYFEPTVHTYPTSEVTTNSATVKGYVLPGSDEITSQGIEYWAVGSAAAPMKVISPMAVNNEVNTIFASGQVMLVTLNDLQQATTYSYRAFVTTHAGTTYGEEQTFTTEGEAGIDSIGVDSPELEVIGYYDLSGRRYEEPQRGLNIVVYSDGSTEKVIIKQ